jgi:hypothetical protein
MDLQASLTVIQLSVGGDRINAVSNVEVHLLLLTVFTPPGLLASKTLDSVHKKEK